MQPDAQQAISWVATYAAIQIGQQTGLGDPADENAMNQSYLIGNVNHEVVNSSGVAQPNHDDAAGNQSILFYAQPNACLPANSGHCDNNPSTVAGYSPYGLAYAVDPGQR